LELRGILVSLGVVWVKMLLAWIIHYCSSALAALIYYTHFLIVSKTGTKIEKDDLVCPLLMSNHASARLAPAPEE
jgi:hypothetical protein